MAAKKGKKAKKFYVNNKEIEFKFLWLHFAKNEISGGEINDWKLSHISAFSQWTHHGWKKRLKLHVSFHFLAGMWLGETSFQS